jgi:hypothetical protein
MNGTVEFVAPSGVAKEAFDAGLNFLCGLLFRRWRRRVVW